MEVLLFFLLLLLVLFVTYVIFVIIVYFRCECTMFATTPFWCDDERCDQCYSCDGREPWKWTDLDCGLSVWDTVCADNPKLPVLIVATGLFINWYDQKPMIEFLVRKGFRVIAVFYRIFEGACTQTRVDDLDRAYDK